MVPLFLWVVGTGCASKPKVDWNTRVGSYTFDDAVREFGPPDKDATLTDGNRITEWFVKEKGGMSVSFGLGSYGAHSAAGVGQTVGNIGGGRVFRRLTFGPEGKLKAAEDFVK
jgi:hypothetical protein